MGGPTGCGGIWVLFWWAGPCSVKFYPIFFDGWGCVPSLLFGLRPRYGRGNGDLLQKDLCQNTLQLPGLLYSVLLTPSRPLTTCTFAGDSWILTHKSDSLILLWGHCSFLLGSGAHKVLFVPSKSLFLTPVEYYSAIKIFPFVALCMDLKGKN